jgi:hypothetical protein
VVSEQIVDRQLVKKGTEVVTQILIKWFGLPVSSAACMWVHGVDCYGQSTAEDPSPFSSTHLFFLCHKAIHDSILQLLVPRHLDVCFSMIVKIAAVLHGDYTHLQLQKPIVYTLMQAGRFTDAHKVLKKFPLYGVTPNIFTFNSPHLGFLIKLLCESNRLCKSCGCQSDLATSTMLIHLLCRRLPFEEAFVELEHMFERDHVTVHHFPSGHLLRSFNWNQSRFGHQLALIGFVT